MSNQDIALPMFQKLLNLLASTTATEGASLLGVEASADLEAKLATLASGGGGTGLVDIVSVNWTSNSSGTTVVNHQLGSTPKFAFTFCGADNAGGEFSNRSNGFWQANSFGTSQRVHMHHGSSFATFSNYIMGSQNNPGQANQFNGGDHWDRAFISAASPTDVSVTRQTNGAGNPGAPFVHRLRIALVA